MANIFNTNSNTLLSGTSGNDTIKNCDYSSIENVTIDAGAGNDKIFGGDGSDYINIVFGSMGSDDGIIYESDAHDLTVNGGTGNDTISNDGGFNAIVVGGAGDDYIRLTSKAKKNLIQYAEGDGNDKIVGFNADDILQITEGSYSAELSGKVLIVTIGDSSITLKNAKNKNIIIIDENGDSNIFNSSTAANLSEIIAEKSVGDFEFATTARDTISATVAYAEK